MYLHSRFSRTKLRADLSQCDIRSEARFELILYQSTGTADVGTTQGAGIDGLAGPGAAGVLLSFLQADWSSALRRISHFGTAIGNPDGTGDVARFKCEALVAASFDQLSSVKAPPKP